MQSKLRFTLYVISVLITLVIIIGCIYEKQQSKTTIHTSDETKHETKQQIKNTIKKIEIETSEEVDTEVSRLVSLGNFRLTAYCKCSLCCGKWANNRPNGIVYGAIGEELKEDYSIAVDPSVIPYGTEVVINGKTYKAQDCGGAINGNEIDIYMEDHNDALEFGVQYAEVFVNM